MSAGCRKGSRYSLFVVRARYTLGIRLNTPVLEILARTSGEAEDMMRRHLDLPHSVVLHLSASLKRAEMPAEVRELAYA